jgi:hypothetical protein
MAIPDRSSGLYSAEFDVRDMVTFLTGSAILRRSSDGKSMQAIESV